MLNHLYRYLFTPIRRTLQRLMRTPSLGVKALIIDASNRVLLVEHTYTPGWHLPGGGIAIGESPKAAILREIQEETGLIVTQDPLLFAIYTHKVYGASDYPILYVVRHFTIANKAPCREIKQVAWFAYDQLPETTTESTRLRINEVLTKLPPPEIW